MGHSGAKLLAFRVGAVAGTKGIWIRPSGEYLAVFGMTLNTYDVVGFLDQRTGWKLRESEGVEAAKAACETPEVKRSVPSLATKRLD